PAPVIKAEDDEVAHSISTIFLFNVIAVFIFPALGRLLGMSDIGFGMWAGTAVNDTSSVVAAASSWSAAAGNDIALGFATIVKLTRTLMIVPIALVLAIRTASVQGTKTENFSFVKVFPWFVIGFILAAVTNTFVPLPTGLPIGLGQLGKFIIVMAMAAIGLNTHLKKLIANGLRPIFLGLCCWIAVAVVSIIVQSMTGLL
ncbi:MAG TPA: putative sulfate exporter family transporter, partial [Clostridiales bacterium UBA8960]|nr:putative sulfate exporter family transporter [Clostridiales bacterium UBA8960]